MSEEEEARIRYYLHLGEDDELEIVKGPSRVEGGDESAREYEVLYSFLDSRGNHHRFSDKVVLSDLN